jgi:ribosomal protein L16 Arg81 hydroxylase
MSKIDLRHILAPVAPDAFIERHWAARPLHIPGRPAKFRALAFDAGALRALWAGLRPPDITAQYQDTTGAPRSLAVEPALVEPLFRSGMTLCFAGLDELHPGLARCAAAVKLGLHYADRVAVNAYWSPDGAGFATHFDCHQTFIVQLEGEKRWRYSAAPLVAFPPRNLSFGDPDAVAAFRRDFPWARFTLPDEEALVEQVLRPGDVLYLPAGTCHRTDARGASLSLTVACWRTSFLELLWQQLAGTVREHAAWRRPPPVFTRPGPGRAPLPSAAEQFIAARLAELRDLVNGWTPGHFARTLLASISDVNPPDAPVAPPSVIRRRDRFDVPAAITCVAEDDGESVFVFAGPVRLAVPSTAHGFVLQLARRRRFRAEDARRWSGTSRPLGWAETREALEVLLSRGLIRRAPPRRRRRGRRPE